MTVNSAFLQHTKTQLLAFIIVVVGLESIYHNGRYIKTGQK